MSIFSILLALGLEQLRPMRKHSSVPMLMRAWVDWMAESLDAGSRWQAICVMAAAILFPAVVVVAIEWAAWRFLGLWGILLVFPLHVAVLYATLGFRQFSQPFGEVQHALEQNNMRAAMQAMRRWRKDAKPSLEEDEQAMLETAHRYAFEDAHYFVFGVLLVYVVFFLLGLGAFGAVLYKLTAIAFERYRQPEPGRDGRRRARLHITSTALQRMSAAAWSMLDYIPSRCTALGFALVGNFEVAMRRWRHEHNELEAEPVQLADAHMRIIQAAGAGALGIERETSAPQTSAERPEQAKETATSSTDTTGWATRSGVFRYMAAGSAWYEHEDMETPVQTTVRVEQPVWTRLHLNSLVALLWRALILWVFTLLLVEVVHWLIP